MSGSVRRAAVIVASTSGFEGKREDTTGPVIREWLERRGFEVDPPVVVADGPPVGEALRAALASDGHDRVPEGGGVHAGAGDDAVIRSSVEQGSTPIRHNDSRTAPLRIIITTGGTGISPTDRTPEQTLPLLDVQLPGIIEQLRALGARSTPMATLTRGLAGFARSTFLLNLPGSPAGVREGLEVLDPILEHLLAQRLGGGRHE